MTDLAAKLDEAMAAGIRFRLDGVTAQGEDQLPVLRAAIIAAMEAAVREIEGGHACCTVGCGAVPFDGDAAGFCPTCLYCQRTLTALDELEERAT